MATGVVVIAIEQAGKDCPHPQTHRLPGVQVIELLRAGADSSDDIANSSLLVGLKKVLPPPSCAPT